MGFSAEELTKSLDHRIIQVLVDASARSEAKKGNPKVTKRKIGTKTRIIKAGKSKLARKSKTGDFDKAVGMLGKTGSQSAEEDLAFGLLKTMLDSS